MRSGSRLARLLLLSQRSAHGSNLLRGLQSRIYGAKDAIGLLHSSCHHMWSVRHFLSVPEQNAVPKLVFSLAARAELCSMQQDLC